MIIFGACSGDVYHTCTCANVFSSLSYGSSEDTFMVSVLVVVIFMVLFLAVVIFTVMILILLLFIILFLFLLLLQL